MLATSIPHLSTGSVFIDSGLMSSPFTIFSIDLSSEGCCGCWPGIFNKGIWREWDPGDTIPGSVALSTIPGRGDSFGLEWPDGVTVSKADKFPPPRTLAEVELRDEEEDEDVAVAGGIKGYGKNRWDFSRSESKAESPDTEPNGT